MPDLSAELSSTQSLPEEQDEPSQPEPQAVPEEPEHELEGELEEDWEPGSLVYKEAAIQPLKEEQEALLLDYRSAFYRSLAALEAEDLRDFYADSGSREAFHNQVFWDYMVALRAMQPVDLSLTHYAYQFTVLERTDHSNGDVELLIREDNQQSFTAYPGVDSDYVNIAHTFVLTGTEEGWRLRDHVQMDSINYILLGRSPTGEILGEETRETIGARVERLLEDAALHLEQRLEEAEAQPEPVPEPYWDMDYNWWEAVLYAQNLVGIRSTKWPIYDQYGGNCNNYTSQCLLAGGIPMDTVGSGQWHWYGEGSRSGSWSGVNEFYDYVNENTGFGLVGETDVHFFSGQEGDIVQMALGGEWRHTVIITQVIRDAQGNTVDYLVCSNTPDQRDYPVSAYPYTQQRLIRIYGWNLE